MYFIFFLQKAFSAKSELLQKLYDIAILPKSDLEYFQMYFMIRRSMLSRQHFSLGSLLIPRIVVHNETFLVFKL